MKKIKYLLPVFLLMFSACWQRQDNEVTEPETPHYRFTGRVVDIDLQTPLAGISVTIVPLELAFPVNFAQRILTTDSRGMFTIDTMYIGTFDLFFDRDGYRVLSRGYFQTYNDTTITYELPAGKTIPRVLEDFAQSRLALYPKLQTSYMNALVLQSDMEDSNLHLLRYDTQTAQWSVERNYRLPLRIPEIAVVNIAFGNDDSRFYISKMPDTLFHMQRSGRVVTILDTFLLQHRPMDIFRYADSLYISDFGEMHVYSINGSYRRSMSINRQNIWMTSIARDDLYFWVTDINRELLYQCDRRLKILETYVPFNSGQPTALRDLSLDYQGFIWIIKR